jgi:hypothetical protein
MRRPRPGGGAARVERHWSTRARSRGAPLLKGARKTMVFAMTGGPCGGKSTAMVKISERLGALGFQVCVRALANVVAWT